MFVEWSEVTCEVKLFMNIQFLVAEDYSTINMKQNTVIY